MARDRGRQWSPDKAAALMKDWPESWAGEDADVPIGRDLVAVMGSFMTHLHQQQLAATTLRNHLNNLWLIGGEIIREVNNHPRLRTTPAPALLLNAVQDGQAPSVSDLDAEEQALVDATARKLLKFLLSSHPDPRHSS